MNKTIFGATLLSTASLATGALAGTATIEVNVPRLGVAEYHRPYVAGWIEDANGASKGSLFVWYDFDMRDNGGLKWLKDLRAWWRKGGREINMPADGISSATRAPGRQVIKFDSNRSAFKNLSNGNYVLVVEAARESGGREVVKVPFNWNGNNFGAQRASGNSELGQVTISYSK
jgi:hypothetical protein